MNLLNKIFIIEMVAMIIMSMVYALSDEYIRAIYFILFAILMLIMVKTKNSDIE